MICGNADYYPTEQTQDPFGRSGCLPRKGPDPASPLLTALFPLHRIFPVRSENVPGPCLIRHPLCPWRCTPGFGYCRIPGTGSGFRGEFRQDWMHPGDRSSQSLSGPGAGAGFLKLRPRLPPPGGCALHRNHPQRSGAMSSAPDTAHAFSNTGEIASRVIGRAGHGWTALPSGEALFNAGQGFPPARPKVLASAGRNVSAPADGGTAFVGSDRHADCSDHQCADKRSGGRVGARCR